MKMQLVHFIDSSHQLKDSTDLHTKKCANLHGHTYKIVVEIEANNDRHGMIIDFGKIKETINILDHQHINDVFAKHGFNEPATAENIALFIKDKVCDVLGGKIYRRTVTIKVAEGYKGDEHSNWIIA